MRPRNVLLAAALIGGLIVLPAAVADAQHRGGGGGGRGGGGAAGPPPAGGQPAAHPPSGGGGRGGARPPGTRPPAGYPPAGGRGGAYYGHGGYRSYPYYGYGYGAVSLTWGFPRWWYPFGYGPYWYGPYWYGAYWYDGGYGGYGYESGGSLKLEVQPKNADVFVDGYSAGIVDEFDGFFQSLDVAPGGHSLTLWCQGYRTVTQQVYVQLGSTLKVRYQMVQLAAGEPQDPRPSPPPEAPALRPRRELPPPIEQPGQPDRRAAPQPPEPRQLPQPAAPAVVGETAEYAQLTIRVQPGGAQIYIDGELWQGPQGTDRLVVHLRLGVHQVEIRKEGFRTFKTDVQIRTGEPTTLNVSLSGQNGQ